jgi:endonuclease III
MAALWPHAGRGAAWLARAHDLLRAHGRALCTNKQPLCGDCPLASACPTAS